MAKPWKWAWPIAALGLGLAWMLSFGLLPNHGVASARSQVSTESPIVFGGDAHYAPFDSLDEHGQPIGFDVELFRAVAAHAGLDVHYRLGNWQQVQADLQAGSIDVIPMLVTPERKLRVRFSQPFMRRYYQAFGKRGAPYVASLDALRGQRVAAQTADMAWEELRRIPGIVLVDTDSEGGALVAVAEGRADYAMAPTFIGYEAKRRFGLEDVVPLSTAFFETEYAFAVRPDRAALLARINSGLTAATRSGEASRLYERWLANLTPTRETWRSGLMIGLWIAMPLFLVAILLLVWWRRARLRAGHLESHDPVTDLANRSGFRKALEPLIVRGAPFAVIRIDLLEIGAVEAMAGHEFVDALLRRLAQRLQSHLALVAKAGDRGFLIAAPGVADAEAAHAAMHTLLAAVNERVEVAGLPIEQLGCGGAALFPEHGQHPDDLMRAAGVASEAAAARPGSGLVYHASLAPDVRRLTLLTDLRTAIRERTLGYALQPKFCLATRRIVGAEMLVRWTHPTHGELQPADFVPIAERTGVIGEMTRLMIEHAVGHLRHWRQRGLDLGVSVNVSVNDLSDAQVVDDIVHMARDVRGKLTLEITETAVMRDPDKAFAAVERLRAGGLRISLDDFGTGNASLTYLRRLAPEEVKIDRSFITHLVASEADQSIVRSTIQLAHSVRAIVTAEGVEDSATMAWLLAAGCDGVQGHYVGVPMEEAGLLERIGAGRFAEMV